MTCEINNTDAEGRLVLADGVSHATTPGVLSSKPVDVVVDMATLTGAQMVATGKNFAGIICNSDALERAAVLARAETRPGRGDAAATVRGPRRLCLAVTCPADDPRRGRGVDATEPTDLEAGLQTGWLPQVLAGRRTGDLVHALPFAPELFRSEFESKVADTKNSVKDRMNAQTSCRGAARRETTRRVQRSLETRDLVDGRFARLPGVAAPGLGPGGARRRGRSPRGVRRRRRARASRATKAAAASP